MYKAQSNTLIKMYVYLTNRRFDILDLIFLCAIVLCVAYGVHVLTIFLFVFCYLFFKKRLSKMLSTKVVNHHLYELEKIDGIVIKEKDVDKTDKTK